MTISLMELMIALLSGGLLQFTAQYLIAAKKSSQNNLKTIIETWREDNERLRLVETENGKKIDNLNNVISNMSFKIKVLESAKFSIPYPMWIKGSDGRIISINNEYELFFLKPKGLSSVNYIGKTDYDLWPDDIASQYRANDFKVLTNNKPFLGAENIPNILGKNDIWIIVKYPIDLIGTDSDQLKAIGGLALPYKDIQEYISKELGK